MKTELVPRTFAGCFMAGMVCSVVSCSRQPASPPVLSSETVAVVDHQIISRAAFQAHLARRGKGAQTSAHLEAALDEMIRAEAIYAKAKAAGFDTNAAVQAAIKRLVAAQYQAAQLPDAGGAPQISDQEMSQYYRAHQADFTMPEKVRAAIIFIKVPGKATVEKQAEYTAAAESVLTEARQLTAASAGFGALARKYSEDTATRYQGGDAGWLPKNAAEFRFGPAVAGAILALNNPGDLTPVIQTRDGLVLARLMEKKPASTRPLSELKEGLAYRLSLAKVAQREAAFQAAMKAGLNIQINRPLLESLARAPAEPRPPGLPGAVAAQTASNP